MKHVLRWIGWALFAYFSVLLLWEYSGINMYDTCLFSLGGLSVGLQSLGNVFDLSPVLMGFVYSIMLAGVVIAAIKKIGYILLNITNLILSVPVMMVLHTAMPYYPPFGSSESFILLIFLFLLFCYLSIIMFIVIALYSIVKYIGKRRHRQTI